MPGMSPCRAVATPARLRSRSAGQSHTGAALCVACAQQPGLAVPAAAGALGGGDADRPAQQWASGCLTGAGRSTATPMAIDGKDDDALVVAQVAPWIESDTTLVFRPTEAWGMQPAGCSGGLAVSVVDGEGPCTTAAEHLPCRAGGGHHAVKRKFSRTFSGIGGQARPSLVLLQPAADRTRLTVRHGGMPPGAGQREQTTSQHGRQQQPTTCTVDGVECPFGSATDGCASVCSVHSVEAASMDVDVAESLTVATQRSLSLN